MTHQEILNKTKAEIDSLCAQAKEKLDAIAPKELEVGKWYKGTCNFESLIFITEIENTGSYNNIYGYGFKWGQWNDLSHLLSNTDHEKSLVEATPQEVEQALIEEAERRYKVGDVVSYLDDKNNNYPLQGHSLEFDVNENILYATAGKNHIVFANGQWATIIEQPIDKFAELKEAYNNGAVIEIKCKDGSWCDVGVPGWSKNHEYRIKPEEKPKIKPRLGRKQERVILDDNNFSHEVCTFHERYKHLAPLVVEFLINNK